MRSGQWQWQFVTFFRILFGLHLLYSAGAYVFFGWVPSAFHNPASPVGHFMVELDKINLYAVVKYIELFMGILVIGNRFVPLAAVMEFPITVMIAYLNLFVEGPLDHRHYYTGIQELAINGIVLLGYGAYFRTMLAARAIPKWLGQPLGTDLRATTAAEEVSPDAVTRPMWLFFIGFMAFVVAASWFLGPVDRRLPPRDWLPPLAAFATMAALVRFGIPKRAGRPSK